MHNTIVVDHCPKELNLKLKLRLTFDKFFSEKYY